MKKIMLCLLVVVGLVPILFAQDRCPDCKGKCEGGEGYFLGGQWIAGQCLGENKDDEMKEKSKSGNRKAVIKCTSEDGLLEYLNLEKVITLEVNHSGSGFECVYHVFSAEYGLRGLDVHKTMTYHQNWRDSGCGRDGSDYGPNASMNQYVKYAQKKILEKHSYVSKSTLDLNFKNKLSSYQGFKGVFTHPEMKTVWEEGDSVFKGVFSVGNQSKVNDVSVKMNCASTHEN